MRYAFTLHDPEGKRLIGFDNAHRVPELGSRFKAKPEATDHWHRTQDDKDADTLLANFFREVRHVLAERGLSDKIVWVEEERRS